jgi:Spectrin repeat.
VVSAKYLPNLHRKLLFISLYSIIFFAFINTTTEFPSHRESWQQLLGLLENREQRLNAAGEIHRFHRDVAEALSRIHDKDAALSDDLGKDSNSVLGLIRKHEGFENDLVALEAQLQVLVEDAVRLQALYPGHNATHIAQQQAVVVSSWSALQERSAQRKEALQASCDLHKFLAQVRPIFLINLYVD